MVYAERVADRASRRVQEITGGKGGRKGKDAKIYAVRQKREDSMVAYAQEFQQDTRTVAIDQELRGSCVLSGKEK